MGPRYGVISFPNFANMLLDMAEACKCSNATSCNMDLHVRQVITSKLILSRRFRDNFFAKARRPTNLTNNFLHRPFSHYCYFCEVSYDMIGTMEDFDEDVEFIARKMNISQLLDHKGLRANQTPESKKNGYNQTERIKAHFSLLDREVRLKLYDLYKMDFEMFGYDAAQYL